MIDIFIEKFNIDDLNLNIWHSICQRLQPPIETDETQRINETRYKQKIEKTKMIEIEHDEKQELEGILRHLTNETGGNIHDNGTIEIKSNSITDSSCHPKNLVDYQNNNYYNTKNDGNAFICFDFKEKTINLTSYSIKSNGNDSNLNNLKNWAIEVSNDNNEWETLDNRRNDSTLKGRYFIGTFRIQKQTNNFYRYLRLRQTGETWGSQGNQYFWFCNIEFYGKLKYK